MLLDRSRETGFGRNPIDRLSEKRGDDAWLAAARADPRARCVIIAGDIPVLRRAGDIADALHAMDTPATLGQPREWALLGADADGPLFAAQLDAGLAEIHQARDDIGFIDLRTIAVQGLVSPEQAGLLGQAKSLMFWHGRHRFCANCGAPTQSAQAGWRRDCASCQAQHFPRTDPVAIMLAIDGGRCLLGRSGRFAANMYSALAGFIEPGETLEDAVRREIKEEAGIACGRVSYLAAQPWPFPASLMIGCLARADTTALTVDHTELEDARWFSREEVGLMLQRRHPDGVICPPPMSIAHFLMRSWVGGLEP